MSANTLGRLAKIMALPPLTLKSTLMPLPISASKAYLSKVGTMVGKATGFKMAQTVILPPQCQTSTLISLRATPAQKASSSSATTKPSALSITTNLSSRPPIIITPHAASTISRPATLAPKCSFMVAKNIIIRNSASTITKKPSHSPLKSTLCLTFMNPSKVPASSALFLIFSRARVRVAKNTKAELYGLATLAFYHIHVCSPAAWITLRAFLTFKTLNAPFTPLSPASSPILSQFIPA